MVSKKNLLAIAVVVFSANLVIPSRLAAQAIAATSQGVDKPQVGKDGKPKVAKAKRGEMTFFDRTNEAPPIGITLTTNLKRIRGDKGDESPWRTGTLKYAGADGKEIVVPIQLKTRGIWRRHNCDFPPVRFNFNREAVRNTVFTGMNRPKLVSYCRNDDAYEQYVLQEYQLYRIYNLFTPNSHRARLVTMTYADESGKVQATRPAIILEEPEELADRVNTKMMKEKGAGPEFVEPFHNALVGIFEYMIGNTDWSIFALHNIELLSQPDGNVIPIPMDFDFSGVVNARYATPDPKLSISSVRQRLFRGYCGPQEQWAKVIDLFKQKKDSIYALYSDPIGKLLRKDQVDQTLKYYDDFYKTINDPKAVKREIIQPCVTGR
ncbi:MAG TPA: hypothetical protein VM099_11360 [Gemmatimonadaceae bacterium]|nr:hypothetical protein [Gemmatimonadaceae bacterium]